MSEVDQIVEVLGGAKVLGKHIKHVDDLIAVSRRGLPARVIVALSDQLGLARDEVGDYLLISRRTRYRAERLKPSASDRAVRLARVIARANKVLGNFDKARGWLMHTNRALGNVIPFSLLDTDLGAQAVLDVLGRIEHGSFS